MKPTLLLALAFLASGLLPLPPPMTHHRIP
jgi:hypothetical protein